MKCVYGSISHCRDTCVSLEVQLRVDWKIEICDKSLGRYDDTDADVDDNWVNWRECKVQN